MGGMFRPAENALQAPLMGAPLETLVEVQTLTLPIKALLFIPPIRTRHYRMPTNRKIFRMKSYWEKET
jgi:hypothetical protein